MMDPSTQHSGVSGYDGVNAEHLVLLLRRISYLLLAVFATLLPFYTFIWQNVQVQRGLFASIVAIAIGLWLLARGQVRAASMLLVLTLLTLVTTLATLGYGIHDIVVIAYPALLISFSLVLPRPFQVLLAALTIAAVGWLVLGARAGLYVPQQPGIGSLSDALVATTVLLITAAMVQLLTDNLRRNLALVRRELVERAQAEAALQASEERYALAARGANDGLWDWDLVKGRVYFSPRWKAMLGYAEEEIGSAPADWLDRVHPDDRQRLEVHVAAHTRRLLDRLELEYRVAHKSGRYLWVLCRGLAVWDAENKATRLVGWQTDITDRKLAEERLRHEALHDTLTGLPNRALFLDRLQQTMQRRQRAEPELFAVLFIDLDRFKTVNDSLGHFIGDQLLVAVARTLERCLRVGDTVARLGGDEFTILLEALAGPEDAIVIVERIQAALGAPFLLGDREVFTSSSIGITLSDAGYQNPEDFLRDADTAMYQAKLRGKACYAVFDGTMHTAALALLQLETDLRRALERQELRLYYQPIVDIPSARTVGFEALMRWQHPTRGLLLPGTFLQMAEDAGLMIALGRWALDEACRQLAAWQRSIPGLPPLTMHVNLAPEQLAQPDLVDQITQILAETGLQPEQLVLEIIERTLLSVSDAAAVLARLHALGVRLSLDDFGTGYSALSYLHELPIRKIKIDRSFIGHVETDHQHQAIVTAIIAMAQALGMDVVAEGVEKPGQYELLQRLGCGYGQGWLFAYPLESEMATAFLSARAGGAGEPGPPA